MRHACLLTQSAGAQFLWKAGAILERCVFVGVRGLKCWNMSEFFVYMQYQRKNHRLRAYMEDWDAEIKAYNN